MATFEEQLRDVANANLDEATKAKLREAILNNFIAAPVEPRLTPRVVEPRVAPENVENETLRDTLLRAAEPGFKYGNVVANIAEPYLADFMEDEKDYGSPMLTGQGYTSNLRHGVGTGLLRDKIMELVSPLTEAGREYNPDDPSFLTKAIANVGATGATLGEELADAGRYAQSEYEGLGSFFDPKYYKKIFTQPYEDVMANLQGILYGGYGNTPQQKYQNLLNLYTTNQGIFTPALNRVIQGSDPSRVVTQQNLVDAVRAENASQAQESRNESRDDYTGGGGTVTIGKGGGETKTVSPRSREAMYAAPARTPEPPPFRRFNTGGLAELEGDTRQLFPVEGGGGLTRRGPNLNPPLGIASVGGQLPPLTSIISGPIINRPMPMPMPFPGPRLPEMPDYSSQFEQIGEQLGGFGKQLDALGSFNEQVGGIGKQFEAVNNKLDSLEKGLGSLGNQIASFENMQKAQPQEVMQPRRPSINPFGLANLFMNMRRF